MYPIKILYVLMNLDYYLGVFIGYFNEIQSKRLKQYFKFMSMINIILTNVYNYTFIYL